MIGNISKGNGFGGLLGYLLNPTKEPEIIGGNTIAEKAAALAREFRETAKQNKKVLKPVRHISIGFAEEDGEINAVTKNEIAEKILQEMGYLLRDGEVPFGKRNNSQYVLIAHGRNDPDHDRSHDHDHIHIVVNAVNYSGAWVSDSYDYPRLEKVLRKIEQDYGLRKLACSWEVEKTAPTHGQQQRWTKEQEQVQQGLRTEAVKPVSEQIQEIILEISKDRPSTTDFLDRLQTKGVNVRAGIVEVARKDSNNQPIKSRKIGLSYELDGVKFQASHLNSSVNQLILRQRITFNPEVDFTKLCELESTDKSLSLKAKLQRAIDLASIDRPNIVIYAQRLQQMGVQPRFRITNNRQTNVPGDLKISGVTYTIDGKKWSGSQLKEASWPKLLSMRKIQYSEEKDGGTLYEVSRGIDLSTNLQKIEIVPKNTNFIGKGIEVAPEFSEEKNLTSSVEAISLTPAEVIEPALITSKDLGIDIVRGIVHDETWDKPNISTFVERLRERGISIATNIAINPPRQNQQARTLTFSYLYADQRFDDRQIFSIDKMLQTGRLTNQRIEDFQAIANLPRLAPQRNELDRLQFILDLATNDQPLVQTFAQRLQVLGVRPHFEFDRAALKAKDIDNAVRGISYQFEGTKITGKNLIDGSWPRLVERRGLGFVAERDLPIMRQVNHGYDLSGATPMVVLSSDQEQYLQSAAAYAVKIMVGKTIHESSRVKIKWDNNVLIVDRKRPEKTILTASLDEDSGQWIAIGPTDINRSDVELLERQTNGRRREPEVVTYQLNPEEIIRPNENRLELKKSHEL